MRAAFFALALATAYGGQFHDPNRPCFRKSEDRREVVNYRMHEVLDMDAAPSALDWRDELKKMGGSISAARQQHQPHYCGACWAFAATSALSDRLRISERGQYPEINLAPQLILDCDHYDNGCYGGDPSTAHRFIHENNATDETCNIYMAQGWYKTGRTCSASSYCYTCSPSAGCSPVQEYPTYHVDQYGSIKGEDQMIAELQRGPITCGVAVTAAFESWEPSSDQDIFVDSTDDTNIVHSISVVGYGQTSSGEKYWVARNSWATWWGEDRGFFKVKRGIPNGEGNLCIECDCQFAVPANFTPAHSLPLREDAPLEAVLDLVPREKAEAVANAVRGEADAAPAPAPSTAVSYAWEVSDEVAAPRGVYQRADKPGVVRSAEPIREVVTGPRGWELSGSVPDEWDWRNVSGVDLTTWNKNQHIPVYCGSCWAQGPTSALSDRLAIKLKNPAVPQINLAPQVIINFNAGGNCDGGDPMGVYQYGHQSGIPDQTCQAYRATNFNGNPGPQQLCQVCSPGTGSQPFSPGNCTARKTYNKWMVGDYYNVPNDVEKIKAEIFNNGPISCGVEVTAKFEAYNGGIFNEPLTFPQINHEISLAGYGVDPNSGKTFFWLRNSWGTPWGGPQSAPAGGWGGGWMAIDATSSGVTTACSAGVPIVSSEQRALFGRQ